MKKKITFLTLKHILLTVFFIYKLRNDEYIRKPNVTNSNNEMTITITAVDFIFTSVYITFDSPKNTQI